MDENFYLLNLAHEFEPLNQALEEIEDYLQVETIPIGGYLKIENYHT